MSPFTTNVIPFLNGDVLEVGAGLGANLSLLCGDTVGRWVCLEPDVTLCRRLYAEIQRLGLTETCQAVHGTVSQLPEGDCFDAVLYLDVLQHISDDAAELRQTLIHLRPGGALVILAPAHPWLYTAFDRAIGHERRYTKVTMRKSVPRGLTEQLVIYLDSVGLLASIANGLLLQQAVPTRAQILFWDRVLIPLSRISDPVLRHSLGKSVLGIWRKPNPSGRRRWRRA